MRTEELYRLNDQVRELLEGIGVPVAEDESGDKMVDDVTHAIADVLDRVRDGLPTGRLAPELRGVIEAAELMQDSLRNGEQNELGVAEVGRRMEYASGVEEALRWAMGEAPWAKLERLIEGED